jgi:hypothetical protein
MVLVVAPGCFWLCCVFSLYFEIAVDRREYDTSVVPERIVVQGIRKRTKITDNFLVTAMVPATPKSD